MLHQERSNGVVAITVVVILQEGCLSLRIAVLLRIVEKPVGFEVYRVYGRVYKV